LVNYPGVGPIYVIFLGLPCWILGILLCYRVEPFNKLISSNRLLVMRIGIFFLAFCSHVLALQQIIGHPFTLNFFAITAFFWLRMEILFHKSNPPNRIMENLGKSSYSIYLMHGIPNHLLPFLGPTNTGFMFIEYWIILISITTIFYFLVERPFHRLARKIKFLLSHKKLHEYGD